MIIKQLILIAAFFILLPCSAYAQNETESIKDYVPPPMFGAPRPIPPKKVQPTPPKMPRLSQPIETTPQPNKVETKIKTTGTAKKTIVPLKKPAHPKIKFEGKPIGKILEKGKVEKNKITPGLEPIDLLKHQKTKLKKNSSKGVVKGPKTMPANKKQPVETEVLFEQKNNTNTKLIDRTQKTPEATIEKLTIKPIKNQKFKLPIFDTTQNGKRKLNLIFSETQDSLNPEQINTLDHLIVKFLKNNPKARLRLEAYASPQKSSLNGDRRLALSRAMAIRERIIYHDIAANRLDVRSLGAQTDIQPMDRVELFLVN